MAARSIHGLRAFSNSCMFIVLNLFRQKTLIKIMVFMFQSILIIGVFHANASELIVFDRAIGPSA
jgi:hypothetical protein